LPVELKQAARVNKGSCKEPDVQSKYLKSAAFAILGMVATPLLAQAQPGAGTTAVAASATPARPDVVQFYEVRKNPALWFRAGQADAGPMLVNILRRSSIEGFARGPQLAAEVEAALAAAQTGNAAAVQSAERVMSGAWLQYVQSIRAPTPGMIYGEKWVTPIIPNAAQVLQPALNVPSLSQHLKIVSDVNPIYSSLRDAALKEAKLPGGGNAAKYAANLERARGIPATGKFVLVDAATSRLWMYENGQVADSMKVVVGKLDYPTPMVASAIWYTTFNPYWHVPDHLAKTAAGKVVREGQAYLKRVGYEVVSEWSDNAQVLPWDSVDWKAVAAGTAQVKLRQLPGPANSMGKMKFNFANSEGIYLHDTPQKEYFAKSNRALSNGCIRLEDAKRFGRWLLGRDAVAPSAQAEQHVALPKGVPVYVTYLTAQPQLGELALARDVYGRDANAATRTAAAIQAVAGSQD
jgi:murein L,D-transpeptidase YcbB/YkuD